ncbi:acyltransferase family protein [Mycolicibacterium rhodesiae]|uniref:Acyltransferase n=1 Tax=Mycolicibacterium rhodesiae TaxID=36814 RepID=A0A1X0IN30_MYCRH|nr:acyltransferase family protein [Mycolicibacterium rhodesiae]MCV7347663.1 acyltransferase [Mycolicibacterium rhodesiae]ORB49231.1 acyltransferase [Mycolicibacterium rhodesiae]
MQNSHSGRYSANAENHHFRPDIEGLRAVAVIAVVLFHAAVPGISGGFVGVDVFFVISGFLITGLLWRKASTTGGVRLRSFYGARARRLLPASAMVAIITVTVSAILMNPLQIRAVIQACIASALYVSNIWFSGQETGYFASRDPSPFLHYWSLGVEEQFYLVWPVLILGTAWLVRLFRRRSRTEATRSLWPYLTVLTVTTIVSFSVCLAVTKAWPEPAFYLMPNRAWQLGLGGVVALTAGYWRRLDARFAAAIGLAGLALILAACTLLTPDTPYPGTAALVPTLGAALVITAGCATPTAGCGRLLGLAPMRAIGQISYSWYLWHWPVLILTPIALGHPLGLPARLAAAAVSAVLAALTLRYLENPLRFSPGIRNSPWRSLGLGALSTALAVTVSSALLFVIPSPIGRGAPATPLVITAPTIPPGAPISAYDTAVHNVFAQVHAAVAESANLTAVPVNLTPPLADANSKGIKTFIADTCFSTINQVAQPECASGDLASPETVALIGDSHAAMFNPAFGQIANQRHWRLESLSKRGCPMLDLPLEIPDPTREYRECAVWRTAIMSRLRTEHPRLIVLSLQRNYSGVYKGQSFTPFDPIWLASLTRLIGDLRSTGAQVLVLGPIPIPQTDVPECLASHLTVAAACALSPLSQSGISAEKVAATAAGGYYADLTDLFCTNNRCPVIIGNTLVYFDISHLTAEYSRILAPVMGALADRALAGD